MPRCLLALAVVLATALGAPAPAGADEILDSAALGNLTPDHQGRFALVAGDTYRVRLTGTVTLQWYPSGPTPGWQNDHDAFWCFDRRPAGQSPCGPQPPSARPDIVQVRLNGGTFGDAGETGVDQFVAGEQAFRSDHVYEATFVAPASGTLDLSLLHGGRTGEPAYPLAGGGSIGYTLYGTPRPAAPAPSPTVPAAPAGPDTPSADFLDLIRPPSIFCRGGARAAQALVCLEPRPRTLAEQRRERAIAYRGAVTLVTLCFGETVSEQGLSVVCAGSIISALNAYLAWIGPDLPASARAAQVSGGAATTAVANISRALAVTEQRFATAVRQGRVASASLQRGTMKAYYGQLVLALSEQDNANRALAARLGRRGARRMSVRQVRAAKRRLARPGSMPRRALATLRGQGLSTAQIRAGLRGLARLVPDRPLDARRALMAPPRTDAFERAHASITPGEVALIGESLTRQRLLEGAFENALKYKLAALARLCGAARAAAARAIVADVQRLAAFRGQSLLLSAASGLVAGRC